MNKNDLEAMIFVAKEPMTIEYMTKKMQECDESITESTLIRWIFELQNEYKNRGINIRQVAGGFEMVTNPECHEIVEQLVPKQYETPPRNLMETLVIVGYNQPVTRAVISRMRNVKNPDAGIEAALSRGLIIHTDEGYVTTDKFLKFFGINDLKELPEIVTEKS